MLKSATADTGATSKFSQDFCQQGRSGAVTSKKNIETTIQKADSKCKRPEAGVPEDGDQSLCSASESGESFSMKKKDRGSECSHKVIEKRRRDRINTSLGELSQLLPAQTNGKQGSGKLEKAEILELTVEYLKSLQSRLTEQQETDMKKSETAEPDSPEMDNEDHVYVKSVNHFGGYKDCTEEVFRFLVNVEAMDMQQPCFQRLMAHLRHQIQLLAESCSEVSSKDKVSAEGGKRAVSKRSFQGTTSSSSSTSSSTGERSGSGSGGKAKRVRLHGHHSSNGKVTQSSSSNENNSNSSDNENGSENSRENQTDSGICLDDDSGKEAENSNGTNGSSINSADTNRRGDSNSSTTPAYPTMLPQGSNIPLRTPFLPLPHPSPTYALHPAGTHFIPVVLHPSVPLAAPSTPTFNGTGQMPFPMVTPAAAAFGVPPHVPSAGFGFPFPYVHPAIPAYGYQASPMGFPLCSWLRKDLAGQGTTNPYNGDSGSNGDDCSIESRNSSESIAIQTDSSGNESSSPDEGGS